MEQIGKLSQYMQKTGLVAEIRKHLQRIMSEFERMCDNMGLNINAGKSKVLTLKRIKWGVVRR